MPPHEQLEQLEIFTTAALEQPATLRTAHDAIAEEQRIELLDRLRAGETIELYLDAVVYAQAEGEVRNRNFWRIAEDRLEAVAADAVGKPFLTDHATRDHSRNGGNIIASKAVQSGGVTEFHQTIHLTKRGYVQDALEHTFRRFSINVKPTARTGELTPSVLCSICETPLRDCIWEKGHYPGTEVRISPRAGDGRLVELVVGNADFLETSAVSVPAVTDVRLLQMRPSDRARAFAAALSFPIPSDAWTATPPKEPTVNIDRLYGLLGLTAGAGVEAIEAAVTEQHARLRAAEAALKAAQSSITELSAAREAAERATAAAEAKAAELEAENLEAKAKAFADQAIEQGKVTAGKLYDLVVATYKRDPKEAEELVAALPVVTRVGAEPQAKRAAAPRPRASADGTPDYEALAGELDDLDRAAMEASIRHTNMKPADYVRLNFDSLAAQYGWKD